MKKTFDCKNGRTEFEDFDIKLMDKIKKVLSESSEVGNRDDGYKNLYIKCVQSGSFTPEELRIIKNGFDKSQSKGVLGELIAFFKQLFIGK